MKRIPPKPVKLSSEQAASIAQAAFALVEPVVDPRFYLLAVDFEKEAGAWYLRVYVEGREARIALNDCEALSRAIGPMIDTLGVLEDIPFSLEVSSPGLFRPLKTAREFEFYKGWPVRISRLEAAANKKKPPAAVLVNEGVLDSFDPASQTLSLRVTNTETASVRLQALDIVTLNPSVDWPAVETALSHPPSTQQET